MPSHHDGPQSPYFTPLILKGNAQIPKIKNDSLSKEMSAALDEALTGSCTAWGIPFQVNEVVVLDGKPIRLDLPPTRARWLVFMHTSDIRPLTRDEHGFTSPMRGEGQLNEHAATYTVRYADGTEVAQPIRTTSRLLKAGAGRRRASIRRILVIG
jgi:hypothetical protein